jgi:hypothetical protein
MEQRTEVVRFPMQPMHQALYSFFEDISKEREQRAYILEGEGAVGENGARLTGNFMLTSVKWALQQHPVTDVWWRTHYLPLLVVASNFGYEFKGPTTEFWGPLESTLGAKFNHESRRSLSSLFRLAVRELQVAEPHDSPWSRQFCHIAWPIAHSVLPLDLQLPLAKRLALIPANLGEANEGEIAALLSDCTTGSPGKRFEQWLRSHDIVHEIVLALIDEQRTPWLEKSLIDRIRLGIASHEEASVQLEVAQRTQRLRAETKDRKPQGSQAGRSGEVLLSFNPEVNEFSFFIELPKLSSAAVTEARLNPIRLRLWGITPAMRVERIFSGFPVPVRLDRLPEEGEPLLGEDDFVGIPRVLSRELSSARLKLQLPLVFEKGHTSEGENMDGMTSNVPLLRPWAGGDFCGSELIVASQRPAEGVSGVKRIGCIPGGFPLLKVDTSEQEARDWLEGMEIHEQLSVRLQWLGGPHSSTFEGMRVVNGDPVVFRTDHDGEVDVPGTENSVEVSKTGLVQIIDYPAKAIVRSRGGGAASILCLEGATSRYQPICCIDFIGQPTIQSLLRKEIQVRLEGDSRLEGLNLRVSLGDQEGGETWNLIEEDIASIPSTVSRQLWERLITKDVHRQLLIGSQAFLRIEIVGLAWRQWVLQQEVFDFRWIGDLTTPRAVNEEGDDLPLVCATGEDPLSFFSERENTPDSLVTLRTLEDVNLIHGGGRCSAPFEGFLDWSGPTRPRLVPRLHGAGDQQGLVDVLGSYFAWARSTSIHVIAELRRQKVVSQLESWSVAILCGEIWHEAESELILQASPGPLEALADVCCEESQQAENESIGFDGTDYVGVKGDAEWRLLKSRAITHLRRMVVPGPDEEMVAVELLNGLASPFRRAHDDLKANLELKAGENESAREMGEADPFSSQEIWKQVFLKARNRYQLDPLVELLWPRPGAVDLAQIDYQGSTRMEIAAFLSLWASRNRSALQGQAWEQESVLTGLLIWNAPPEAYQRNWHAVAARMLVDRGMSRAIRYAAIRHRIALDLNGKERRDS